MFAILLGEDGGRAGQALPLRRYYDRNMDDADARLDLIAFAFAFANGVRVDPSTPGGDADLTAYLIGDLCEYRNRPVFDAVTNRRRSVLERHDAEHLAELAARHRWPHRLADEPS